MSALAKFLLLRPKGVNLIAFLRSISGYLASWTMQELTGTVAIADNVAVPLGRQLLYEDFTAGLWVTGGTAAIDDADSFTSTGAGGARANDSAIASGKTYTMRFKGTTTASGILVRNYVNNHTYITISSSGAFDEIVTTTANGDGIYIRNDGTGTTDIDWANSYIKQTDILDSSAGLGLLDGTYNAAVVLDADGAGSIPRFAAFNGSAVLDLLSAEHNSALGPKSFEVIAFLNDFTWDATKRVILNIYVDANNYFMIYASTTPGELVWEYNEAGALSSVTLATGSPSGLFSVGLGVESDVMQAVYKGVQTGADQALAGTFVGNYTIMSVGASDLVPNDGAIASIAYAPTEFTGLLSAATRLQIDAAFGVS